LQPVVEVVTKEPQFPAAAQTSVLQAFQADFAVERLL
jgi:hypothetical protein